MLCPIFYDFALASVIDEFDKLQQWAEIIRQKSAIQPQLGLIAGTGLGNFVDEALAFQSEVNYHELPGFPISTVESHSGKFVFGHWHGVPLMVMKGRFHYYEGYKLQEVTLPIRLMKLLGVEKLMITNAAGGLNTSFQLGDLMLITDHINLLPGNPLIGKNDIRFGSRFPDMSQPYHIDWYDQAFEKAKNLNIPVQKGVYVAVPGPSLETRAEYRFLRLIGADAVGMSTVPEVIVARHMGMKVLAVSVITDLCNPDLLEVLTLEQVLETAQNAEPKLTTLLGAMLLV